MSNSNFIEFEEIIKCVDIKQFKYSELIHKSFKENQINFIKIFLKYYNINEIDENRDTLLHFACKHSFPPLVKYLLDNHINVNAKDKYGNTALNYIAATENRDATEEYTVLWQCVEAKLVYPKFGQNSKEKRIHKLLLKTKSIDINDINNDKKTALELAIENKNVYFIRLLIKYCHSKIIKIKDRLLHETVCRQRTEILKLILPYVDNINSKLDKNDVKFLKLGKFQCGETALHTAVRLGNEDIINLLLRNDINVNLEDEHNSTAIHLALHHGLNDKILLSLVEYGAKCSMCRPLEYSMKYNNIVLIQLILSTLDEWSIDGLNAQGESALHTAVKMNNAVIVNLLLHNNINVNLVSKYDKLTALDIALNRKLDQHIIESLLIYGAKCNTNPVYDTTLNYAIKYNNAYVIKTILSNSNKMDINVVNWIGESALHTAMRVGNKIVITLLLKSGINVNLMSKCEQFTALHLALSYKLNEQIILSLLEYGADCNLSSKYDTTLNYAIKYGNTNIIKLVLNKIDQNIINSVNEEGESALHTAVNMKNEIIINLLLKNNIDVNLTIDDGSTALDLAFYHKLDERIVLSLLKLTECNFSSDFKYASDYDTTLDHAISYDNLNIIKMILSKLDQHNIIDLHCGERALHTAVCVGNLHVINAILNKRIDKNKICFGRNTALQTACVLYSFQYDHYRQNIDIVELLLPYHVINNNQSTFDNIVGAFTKLLQNYKERRIGNSILDIMDLLLFEGHVIIDSNMMQYVKVLPKEELQLMLLSLEQRKQLIHDEFTKEFYFHNLTDKPTSLLSLQNDNCDYNCLLQYYNEIKKMNSHEILPTHKITYFQMLCMNKYQIASTLCSEAFRQPLNNYCNFENKFPEYSWLLKKKYSSGKKLYLENIIFTKCITKALPIDKKTEKFNDPINIIIKKLSKFDILNFIKACRQVKTIN